MKEHLVDLEIAKELKINGFPQKSYFQYEMDNLGKIDIFKIFNIEIEFVEYRGLLARYLRTRNDIDAIIKGLRNTEDFEYEKHSNIIMKI